MQYLLFLAATDNRLFRRSGAICIQLSNVLQSQQASPENRIGNELGTFGNVERVTSDAIIYRSQDKRAVVTLILLLASIVGFSLPYIIFAGAHVPVSPGSPAFLIALLVGDMYLLIPIVDAIVVWRNRDIKESAMTLYKRMRNMFVQYASIRALVHYCMLLWACMKLYISMKCVDILVTSVIAIVLV